MDENMPPKDSSPHPLFESAFKGFFGMPWPRKPIPSKKGASRGTGHSRKGGKSKLKKTSY